MATDVDICNMALARLGDSAGVMSIDPPDPSNQAEQCARFYPIARDRALAASDWHFARIRAALTQTASQLTGWSYTYSVPSDCIAVRMVLPGDIETVDGDEWQYGRPYTREVDVNGAALIGTDVSTAICVYTRRIADASRYTAEFVDATAWLLASLLAGPMVKGKSGADQTKSCYSAYLAMIGQAAAISANQGRRSTEFTPSAIAAR